MFFGGLIGYTGILDFAGQNRKSNGWKDDKFGNQKNNKKSLPSDKICLLQNSFKTSSINNIDFLGMFSKDTELNILDIKEIYDNLEGYLRYLKDLKTKYQIEEDSWVHTRAKKIENYLLYKKLNNSIPNKKEITKKRKI